MSENIIRYSTYNKGGVFQTSYSTELAKVKMNPVAMARDAAKNLDGYYTASFEDGSEEIVEDFRFLDGLDLDAFESLTEAENVRSAE